jgi:hypothetical protein
MNSNKDRALIDQLLQEKMGPKPASPGVAAVAITMEEVKTRAEEKKEMEQRQNFLDKSISQAD